MSMFKATVKGTLEFGTQKAYDLMMAHFQKRMELYYKNDILLKTPSFFNEETFSITVPRQLAQCSEKTWKNTLFLLRELRAFAVAGEFCLWVTDEKNALCCDETIVPQGDKVATTEYLRGVERLKKLGNEAAAIESLNKAIEKFERYYQAFERRGMAYLQLGKIEDAIIDFSKSISLYKNAEAYLGRAQAKMQLGDTESALIDFQAAIDNAVPYQPVFWMSRRMKGESHLQVKDYEKAIFELKFVTKRVFKDNDPNFVYRKQAWQAYGEALLSSGMNSEAAAAFRQALSIESCAVVQDLLSSVVELRKPSKSSASLASALN